MTRALLVKELKVLWTSPLPYVLGAVLHVTLGVLGHGQVVGRAQAVFQPLVPIAGFLVLLSAPVLTARLFAEESRSGSLELLLAVPVRTLRLVLGKYLAALLTLFVLLAPVSLFAVLLAAFGDPDAGPVITGLLGLALLAAALVAVGTLSSALTTSQPVAAVGSLFAVLILWFAHVGSDALAANSILASLSISERLRGLAGGLVDLSDVVFFVAVAAVALTASVAAVEARRWR
ncbi:MAG TPA: ABC transporter permease subunit [Actinomycetota bacterium]|nr:ABC transporter permease subunit [Actinomycetota bacterium]